MARRTPDIAQVNTKRWDRRSQTHARLAMNLAGSSDRYREPSGQVLSPGCPIPFAACSPIRYVGRAFGMPALLIDEISAAAHAVKGGVLDIG